MKKLKLFSKENTWPLVQLILLINILLLSIGLVFNVLPYGWTGTIKENLNFININIGGFYIRSSDLIQSTLYMILIGLCCLCYHVRQSNKTFLLNRDNVYHDYCYQWYWICSKILGIKKCNFVNIPIYMQMKLVINQVFDTPFLFEEDYPKAEEPAVVKRKNQMARAKIQECNLILEDTYQISYKQIPKEKQSLYTVKVSRYNPQIPGRHYSQSFVQKIMDVVNKLDKDTTINLYATTNPQNTLHIARCVFTMANRGNIAHLVIFQQSASQGRHFENMGIKIY